MRILVYGPTSYIGECFIRECLRRGWEVVAKVRNPVKWEIIGFNEIKSKNLITELDKIKKVDAAINFAYVQDSPWHLVHRKTRALISSYLHDALHLSADKIIEISSLAVFGIPLKMDPIPAPLKMQYGNLYMEQKLIAERTLLFEMQTKKAIPVIIRLGNVIGPNAKSWTSNLAKLIILQMPLGNGISNSTYINNIINYICHIITTEKNYLRAFGPIHHIAEFSDYSWKDIVDKLGERLDLEPRYSEQNIKEYMEDDNNIVKNLGKYLPYIFGVLPKESVNPLVKIIYIIKSNFRIKKLDIPNISPVYFEKKQFRSYTLEDWIPPFSFTEAMDNISEWLKKSGYSLFE
jgi:nucleoside-diphosphate-sugar epimerase